MELKPGEKYSGFCLNDIWEVREIESIAYLFEHEKSGARLLYLKNKDENKVFCASFRTPSENSYGTAHILEHSVLCGSEKYPLKEPFVELIKSSMNTFLNAMTYPDKTMYPVASLNSKDLLNLTDVYLDAVFNPLIKKKPEIFMQEGWHYHLENELDDLTINGVVYSEMKGAYSSPVDLLENEILKSLYPDVSYRYDSGGNPDDIPNLTYESFISFYERHYNPSNCYLYLYGDMDPEPFIDLIDSYVSAYGKTSPDTLPEAQENFTEPRYSEALVPTTGSDGNGAYFAYSFRVGDASDSLLSYEMNVLDGILFDSDSSPLKKALMDAGIADEISSEYTTGLRQPFYSIIAKNADAEKFDLFVSVIEGTLASLCENGIDPLLILSSLNSYEFDLREADSGSHPKGLIYLIDIMESWLYGNMPTAHLEFEKYLKHLRSNENSQFYQNLIKTALLDNKNRSIVRLLPEKGLEAKKSNALMKELLEYKASLPEDGPKKLVYMTNELIKLQSEPDSEEARNSIPSLRLSDLQRSLPKPDFSVEAFGESRIFCHQDACRGIVYFDLNLPAPYSSLEDISALELLTRVLGVYKTSAHSEEELAKLIGIYLGEADAVLMSYPILDEMDAFSAKISFSAKALAINIEKMFEISMEILSTTIIDDPQRLLRTVSEELSRFDRKMISAAHSMAIMRIMAMESERGAFADALSGFLYRSFLEKAKASLEKGETYYTSLLSSFIGHIAAQKGADALLTCDASEKKEAISQVSKFLSKLPKEAKAKGAFVPSPNGKRNEAVLIPSNVNYVGIGSNYKKLGLEFSPILAVVRKNLASGYLWETVRVIGGAYGAMVALDKAGLAAFVSYRDPKLKETLAAYENIPKAISGQALTERDKEKLIISTISDIDAPKPAYAVARSLLSDIYMHESWEGRMADRAVILDMSISDLKGFASFFEKVLESASICVIGEERSIQANAKSFDTIVSSLKEI